MTWNLRKCFCLGRWAEKQAEPTPEYKPTFRRKMTPDDLRVENLGKRIWWRAKNNARLDDGIFVGYDSASIVAAEERCGLARLTFEAAVEDCWIEMELEEQDD